MITTWTFRSKTGGDRESSVVGGTGRVFKLMVIFIYPVAGAATTTVLP